MKKIYNAPTIICVKMMTSRILSNSLSGDGLNMKINNSSVEGAAESRDGGSVFDDEE